ncbi:MAG: hypothetical protein IH991_06645 [Planctomycetes bacterium]|nr:hypothetical protein [Planctomycetota bacterium]
MNAKRRYRKHPKIRRALSRMTSPFRGRARHAVFAVSLVAMVVIVADVLWQKFGTRILASSKYQISEATVVTTPPPSWIKSNVKAEVIRDGGLADLRIFDKQVVTRVANAFTVHPWVEKVVRVRKQPEKVVVELAYRQPVAFVEVTYGGSAGLVPVDPHGVLLPPSDFVTEDTQDYLRIAVVDLAMHGSLGTVWRDKRVAEAAQIASIWRSAWRKVDLYRVVCPQATKTTTYMLETRRGDRIIWGRPPGTEVVGEATAARKIAQLVRYVQQDQAFQSASDPVQLDVRSGTVRTIPAKTASRVDD